MSAGHSSPGAEHGSDTVAVPPLRHGWRTAVAAAVAAIAASGFYLQILPRHMRTPLSYEGDGLMIFVIIKSIVQGGWYLTNERLGMPGAMRLHDFPGADNLCCAFFKLLALFTDDPFLIANIFFLLTFGFSAAGTAYALRQFGISRWPSFVGGMLFSFLPYHFFRGVGHLFYSAYFLVPLAALVAVWIANGTLLSAGTGAKLLRSPRFIFGAFVCLLLGANMVYYPFFACFFFVVAIALAAVRRAYVNAGAGVLLIAVVVASLLLNQLPVILHLWQRSSTTFVARAPAESELYGLKITQLLLPRFEHRVPALNHLAYEYGRQYPLVNENSWVSLGFLGSAGFLGLVAWLLFWRGRQLRRASDSHLLDSLSVLNAAGILLGTVGGFSSLLALLLFANIRAYNRLGPFIAFFSLAALCVGLDWLRQRFATSSGRRAGFGAFACVIGVLGCLDQTAWRDADVAHLRATQKRDKTFYSKIEASLPRASMVFQLPYMAFPESGWVLNLPEYAPLAPYLNTEAMRWSYAAIKGSRSDLWQQEVTALPPDEFLRRIVLAGFVGVTIERRGFSDRGAAWENALRPHATRAMSHPDRSLIFFDVTGYADALRASMLPAQWDQLAKASLYTLRLAWGGGFSGREGTDEAHWRWCSESGLLTITNDSPEPRTVRVSMKATSADPKPSNLRIRSAVWNDDIKLDGSGRDIAHEFTLPPGSHSIAFECDGRPAAVPDPRRLVWRIDNFRIE
jgi:phosphoglycerol transferase